MKLGVLIIVLGVLLIISAAFLAPDKKTAASSEKTGFVTKILADLDFTGAKTVADSITKSPDIRININPFGD